MQHIFKHCRLKTFAAAAVFALTAFPLSLQNVSAADTQTDLPVIDIQLTQAISDEYQDASISAFDENGSMEMLNTNVKIRLRGNSSRRTKKPSYKLHFPEKANPFGLGDGKAKTWALIGNGMDASLLRNWTAMHLAEQFSGIPYTPNCRSVELHQNGVYHGVYLLIETVSINKNRIHITEAPDEVENNGYLLEKTTYAMPPEFWIDTAKYEIKSRLSDDSTIAEKQKAYIRDYADRALHALQSGNYNTAAAYIDIDSLVDNCLVNELCKNADVGWDSYYLSKDAGGKLTFQPVWDFDLAFGNARLPACFQYPEGENPFALCDSCMDANSWLCYAMRSAWFRKLLKARWEEMLPQIRTLPDAVRNEAALHQAAYEENHAKAPDISAYLLPYPDSDRPYDTHAAQAEILSDWIEKRIAWLDAYYQSPEFDAGIFPDQNGVPMPLTNVLSVSLLANSYADNYHKLQYSGHVSGHTQIASINQLMLAGGQQYKLSFDYSCTGAAELTCLIQNETSGTETSAVFSAVPEAQTAEFIFTQGETALSGALSISADGNGSVQISDLCLCRVQNVSGDLNGDGLCSGTDAALLLQLLLGKTDAALTAPQAADVNADGIINAKDLTLLKRAVPAAGFALMFSS